MLITDCRFFWFRSLKKDEISSALPQAQCRKHEEKDKEARLHYHLVHWEPWHKLKPLAKLADLAQVECICQMLIKGLWCGRGSKAEYNA